MLVLIASLLKSSVSACAAQNLNDEQLRSIYDQMKSASAGVAMDLDSTFGAGRCNCVCKNNNAHIYYQS